MTYSVYVKTGPFVNNAAPGISANMLNSVENYLVAQNHASTDTYINADGNGNLTVTALNITPVPVIVSGTVSGTTALYQYMIGTVKRALVIWTNYKSSSAQSLTLPVAFTNNSYWIVSELQGGKLEGLSSGTAQTFSVLSTVAVTGGSQGSQAFLNGWSQGLCRGGCDTIRITVTGTTAASAIALIEGV